MKKETPEEGEEKKHEGNFERPMTFTASELVISPIMRCY